MTTSLEQKIVLCIVCKNPALRFCNNCQVDLCLECVSTHVEQIESLSHNIAPTKDRKTQLVIPECGTHPGRRCEAYCQQCKGPICSRCLIGPHKGHDAYDIVHYAENKKQKIKKHTEEMEEKLLPFYRKTSVDIKRKLAKATTEYAKFEENHDRMRKIWQQKVNAIFDNISSRIQSQKTHDLENLTINQTDVQNTIPDLIELVQCNKEILQSNQASAVTKFTNNKRQNKETQTNFDFDAKIPTLITNTSQGTELYIKMGEIEASLTHSPFTSAEVPKYYMGNRAKLIATVPTHHHRLYRVACVGSKEAWVSVDKNIIKRIAIQDAGTLQNTLNISCEYCPVDIALTRHGELIYSDNRTVNIFNGGMSKTLLSTPEGWKPRGLCCTRSGDILVSVFNMQGHKILRYQGETITQEIYKDKHGNQLFTGGDFLLFLTENSNRDICVSDGNAGKVIVLNKSGCVQFQYDGIPAKMKKSFDPRSIVTNSLSQIIVSDMNNHCIHILDQHGKFLGCLDNCGLDKPSGLSVDSEGKLWVGLLCTGEVKVIEYLK